MAKTSDLLVQMEDLDDILSNLDPSGSAGATRERATRSLNRAQDLLERFIGRKTTILATVDDTISQTVGQEYTALPARTIRIDAVWFLDATSGLPTYEIDAERTPGGARGIRGGPLFDASSDATGRPDSYWWSMGDSRLYWDRQPDTTNNIRIVGFFGADDMTITGTDTTFAYDDAFIVPVASVATEVFRLRRRDDWKELQSYADSFFQPVVDQMSHSWRHQQGDLRGSFPQW